MFLDGIRARFTGTNADNLFQGGNKNFAIANFSGVGRFQNRIDDIIDHIIIDGDFKLNLGQEINHVLGTSVKLGMAFLTAKALHLRYCYTLYVDIGQSLANIIHFKGLNNSGN